MVEIRKGIQWFDAGYKDIVSVIPPNVGLIPRSKITQESLGKIPGLKYSSGLWGGYAWREYNLSRKEVEKVDASGSNIGLKASHFPAFDLDITDEKLVEKVGSFLESKGFKWYRIGRPPKRLYISKLDGEPFRKMQLTAKKEDERHVIEILGEGQQYVVGGSHPSGYNYAWNAHPPIEEIPSVNRQSAQKILEELAELLSASGYVVDMSVGMFDPPNQPDLQAPSKEYLDELVSNIPNTLESHPTRDHYIRMAAAIKAAGGEFETFWKWAAKWPGRDGKQNTIEQARKDWQSLKQPFKLGWEWLLDQARLHHVNTAIFEFSAIEEARAVEEARLYFPNSSAIASVREATIAYSDLWVSDRFVRSILTLCRRVIETKSWLVWTGFSWQEDKAHFVHAMARNFLCDLSNDVERLSKKATEEKAAKALRATAKQLSSLQAYNMVMECALRDTRLVVPVSFLDKPKNLLNTPAGPVNLATGERMVPDPSLLLTKSAYCPVDFAPPKNWLKFLYEITNGDKQYMDYLQKVAGYVATGYTKEQAVFFLWGTGGNGKSVFARTIQHVLGDYASSISLDVLLEKQSSSDPVELAVLRGQRLAVVNETPSSKAWNEARLKLFAGGDIISARRLYGEPFSFELSTKLMIVGNAKPVLSDVDEAVRRRLHLLPFTFKPSKPDPELQDKLLEESPRILGWIVQGASKWHKEMLGMPPAVAEESTEFLDSNDAIGAWLMGIIRAEDARCRTVDLYESYRDWCISEGEQPVSIKRFSALLQNRGFKKRRNSRGQFEFEGLEV